MPDNGAGTYGLPQSPFVTSTPISSSAVNSNFSDIATGLNARLTRNGESAASANLPMAGFRHTGVGDASGRTMYAAAGQVQDGALIWGGTSGGSAAAQTITLAPGIAAYAAGQRFSFIPGYTSAGTWTLAVNGLAAKAVVGGVSAAVPAEVVYDGTSFHVVGAAGWVGLTTATAVAVAAADFLLPAGFVAFRMLLVNLAVGTSGSSIAARCSADAGATFEAGATDYIYTSLATIIPSTASVTGISTTHIDISGPLSTSPSSMLELLIQPGTASGTFRVGAQGWLLASTPEWRWIGTSGSRSAAGARNAIRLLPTAGTFSANISLLGLRA